VVLCACDIQENAFNPQRTTEADNWSDGQYTAGLIEKAEIPSGSNIRDDHLCPNTVTSPRDTTVKLKIFRISDPINECLSMPLQ